MIENAYFAKTWGKGLVAATALSLITGCEQLESWGLTNDAEATTDGPSLPLLSGETETRDVEAPEIFQKTESGLWDGRPSLGGVWVAHPDVTDPERVIIRNQSNDKFVIGALFRRERDNPGPSLQVSSDAAEELGMLAGAPVTLNVTALRREEAPVAPPAAETSDFDAPVAVLAGPEDVAATPLDALAGAEAAVDAIAAPAPAPVVAPAPIVPVAAPAPAAEPAPIPPAPVAAPASSLAKPFIQIGIFSLSQNASNTASALRNDGLSATVLSQTSQGKSFWRVIVGPAPNAADRAFILEKVRALGFDDAYPVSN